MRNAVLLGCALVVNMANGLRAEDVANVALSHVHASPNHSCEQCQSVEPDEHGPWFTRNSRKLWFGWQRLWRRQMQHKQLQHAERPPFYDANFGYHPTCWRKFPPLCRPCPPPLGDQPQHLLPAPAAPVPAPAAPAAKAVNPLTEVQLSDDEPVYRLTIPAEYIEAAEDVWKPTRAAIAPR